MRTILAKRMGMDDIHEICFMTQGEENDNRKAELYELTLDEDDRIAANALWTFTHFALAEGEWLFAKHDDLIDRALAEKNVTRLRLLLTLLLRQPFRKETLRTDFIDFCLSKITACSYPYAIRALCMKLAYEQMRFYPELLAELKATLDLLGKEALSPGLASARRQVMKRIEGKAGLNGRKKNGCQQGRRDG